MSQAGSDPPETRCACGRLLARLTDAGIELKCSRCRRIVVIAWHSVTDERTPQQPDSASP
jgi:phage FluMu protein Com